MSTHKNIKLLKVAVVGHTNAGKTSLLRTLSRDVTFGEVSSRPATTRHVEGVSLLVGEQTAAELYDTPGLEDSAGLHAYLDSVRGDRRRDGLDVIHDFLESDQARSRFAQEAKALRKLLACDVALYVIDARDRVLGRYKDELEILAFCARPVVPVLNFTASDEAKISEWREHLARVNMHAIAEFDSVVLDEQGERRLFEKMRSLLDPFRETLEILIDDRVKQRARLIRVSADLIAELLVDVAAHADVVPVEDEAESKQAMERMQQAVRLREQRCVDDFMELHRFRVEDFEGAELPVTDGRWGLDLFSPEAMKDFGVRAGSAAAAGAMAGLAVDAMFAGLSMGTAAVTGAALGALYSAAKSHGKRLIDRARGYTELRVSDATLRLLAARQSGLARVLLLRGHASQERIAIDAHNEEGKSGDIFGAGKRIPEALERAKLSPEWSALSGAQRVAYASDDRRAEAVADLAGLIERVLGKGT